MVETAGAAFAGGGIGLVLMSSKNPKQILGGICLISLSVLATFLVLSNIFFPWSLAFVLNKTKKLWPIRFLPYIILVTIIAPFAETLSFPEKTRAFSFGYFAWMSSWILLYISCLMSSAPNKISEGFVGSQSKPS